MVENLLVLELTLSAVNRLKNMDKRSLRFPRMKVDYIAQCDNQEGVHEKVSISCLTLAKYSRHL